MSISKTADFVAFESAIGFHLFAADGSQIFDIDSSLAPRFREAMHMDSPDEVWALLDQCAPIRNWITVGAPEPPPLGSISLNVAQACNISCGYCYADEGRFGGTSKTMSVEVAKAAVNRLIEESAPGADLLLGFMGGEPLLNRKLIHEIVPYAIDRGTKAGHRFRFSLTTNGTLIQEADVRLFASHPFAVQISIDGPRQVHDKQRPQRDGTGTYDRILESLGMMERIGRPKQLSARVTVTKGSRNLLETLDHLIGLGFDDVGFAHVLVSPDRQHEMDASDFQRLLAEMRACGEKCLRELSAGNAYGFSNFLTAMEELHRGSHKPYPCGAGAAYLSASADGTLYACHRLIEDHEFKMGDVRHGSDLRARQSHLEARHVDKIEPCRRCWARYLCGGGCYHEVAQRERVACDYIRGWLEFCLSAYAVLSTKAPGGFQSLRREFGAYPPVSFP